MPFFEIFAAALAGFYALIPSYGLAIILLTLAVRLLLLPLSIKQTRSMREMQRIQPEIKKLQAKYKNDRQKLNEEMMNLYREHGVNPFGGCLPLLMQMPVFIALYRVISAPLAYMGYRDAAEGDAVQWAADPATRAIGAVADSALADGLRTAFEKVNEFLYVMRLDCSPANVLNQAPEVDGGFAHTCHSSFLGFLPYVILILLMGFTTWYQQKQMSGSRTGSDDNQMAQQMQMMGRIMPVMLMVFSWTFPAGLTLYWLTTNVWTIGQQRLMFHVAPPLDPGGAPPPKGGSPVATKPSSGKPGKPSSTKPQKGAPKADELPSSSKSPNARRKKKR